MHIAPPRTSPLLTLALTGTAASATQWQSGQVLNATVLEAQRDGTLLLQLETHGKPVQARSPQPLNVGQQVKVMVEIEANRVVLRLLDTATEEPVLQQAWRTALPRQMPLANVLHSIARLVQAQLPSVPGAATSATTGPVPGPTPPSSSPPIAQPLPLPDIRPADLALRPQSAPATPPATAGVMAAEKLLPLAAQLMNQLPESQRLTTTDGLRQAILNSGVFLEARLARGDTAALQEDFRANLLRLLGAVREQATAPAAAVTRDGNAPTLPASLLLELSQQIEGALARVKVQQLHNVSAQSDPNPAWLLELPLRNGVELEVLRLRIQREEGHRNGGGAAGWSVRLHFDNARHGNVDSVITLLGGKVGVSFWATQPQTADRFRLRLEELRGQLQHAGLEVEHLRSTTGHAAPEEAPLPSGLVNLSV
jgi:hypothetical protein